MAKIVILPVDELHYDLHLTSYTMYPSVLHTGAGVGSRPQSSPKMNEDGYGAQVPYG